MVAGGHISPKERRLAREDGDEESTPTAAVRQACLSGATQQAANWRSVALLDLPLHAFGWLCAEDAGLVGWAIHSPGSGISSNGVFILEASE